MLLDEKPMDQIHQIVADGKFEEVKALLAAGPDCVQAKLGENGDQPLHAAAWHDEAKILELLLDHGAEIDGRNRKGETPLHLAARNGSVSAVKVLIQRGADVNVRDESDFTPAFYAARGREQECTRIVRRVMKAGAAADLNLAVCDGNLALAEKIFAEDPDAVQHARVPHDLVLDAVINIQCRIWEALSPANTNPQENLAVMQANDGILRLLLAHGAPTDAPQVRYSPLFESCQMHHPYITELLLEHGANPNVKYQGSGLKRYLRIPGGGDAMLKVLEKYGFKFQKLY
jgi:cytohesin